MSDTTTDTDTTLNLSGGLSVLGGLKERRGQIAKAQVLDIYVPRWEDPEILVRCLPVEHPFIRSKMTWAENGPKAKIGEREVDGNCDLLVKGCIEIWGIVNGQRYSLREGDPKGDPTVFDADLAINLGLDEEATARQVVKALFFTDGDILYAAQKLVEFSGYRQDEGDRELLGE